MQNFSTSVRDAGQVIGIFTIMLLFVSPVFYPISALPPECQGWLLLNPLAFILRKNEKCLFWDNCLSLSGGHYDGSPAFNCLGHLCLVSENTQGTRPHTLDRVLIAAESAISISCFGQSRERHVENTKHLKTDGNHTYNLVQQAGAPYI
jgi:hypothetical protein